MSGTPVVDPAAPAVVAVRERERTRLREAAEAFESILIQQLVRRMREAQLEKGFFGDGTGASTYEGIFEERFSVLLARGSPFGVADMLEAQWLEREVERKLALGGLERAQTLRSALPVEPGRPPQVPPFQADEVSVETPSALPVEKENHENP